MKILVFAHHLEVGGSQVNAIDLAVRLREIYGHDVFLFATPGPMVKLAEEKGLRFLPAPDAHAHPSSARMGALRAVVRRERPDLIHVWDWPQCLDAYYSGHLLERVPMVVSSMTMVLPSVLPKALPTTFGTPALVDQAAAAGYRRVALLLPPVDVHWNAAGAVDPRPLRERYGIEDGGIILVTVSRLAQWQKAESLRRTIDAVRTLDPDLPLRLLIVGDGTSYTEIERLAAKTNVELGRPAVVLTGALLDPRPAYALADIVVGMGSSALRGMAFGKPVVIVGEQGFSAPLIPETAESFYYNGAYGRGDGNPGNARLISDIRGLAERPDQLPVLGEFSRKFVLRHFSLETVCARLEEFCRAAVAEVAPFHLAAWDGLKIAAAVLGRKFVPRP